MIHIHLNQKISIKPQNIVTKGVKFLMRIYNSEKIQMQEGCLTFPGLYLNITRPSEIEVEYEDIQQQTQTKKLQGIMARVFLHELDHLYGVCFVDRAAKLSVKLAQQRIKKNLKKQGNHEFIR